MYKRCVTEQSARRQREMENGMLIALETHQYEDITISDLCVWLNVPRKTFYRYFGSKEGALYALIDHTLMDFNLTLPFSYENDALSILESFFLFWKQHKELLDVLIRNRLHNILFERVISLVSVEQALLSKLLPDYTRMTREYAITYLISGLMSVVVRWHHSGFKLPAKQMAAIVSDALSPHFIGSLAIDLN